MKTRYYIEVIEQLRNAFQKKDPSLMPTTEELTSLFENEPEFIEKVREEGEGFYNQVCMWIVIHDPKAKEDSD